MLAKYNKIRQLLAESNLDVANTTRIIDDIPTRSELIQYERRFVELYHTVAYKLEETKKYYSMYNTLDTTLSFLQKEVELFFLFFLILMLTIPVVIGQSFELRQ